MALNINKNMMHLGNVRSVIRETFEYGNKRAKEIGRENVYDFSLGNPCVPAPDDVHNTMLNLLQNGDSVKLHGYTSAQGAEIWGNTVAAPIFKEISTQIIHILNLQPDKV